MERSRGGRILVFDDFREDWGAALCEIQDAEGETGWSPSALFWMFDEVEVKGRCASELDRTIVRTDGGSGQESAVYGSGSMVGPRRRWCRKMRGKKEMRDEG